MYGMNIINYYFCYIGVICGEVFKLLYVKTIHAEGELKETIRHTVWEFSRQKL
jgi:hypothetical protein